jgi:hypothetical protein
MTNRMMLIAGSGGAKSTFVGGLLQHVQNEQDYSITPSIEGNAEEYRDDVLSNMFTDGEYPEKTRDGYVVEYEIKSEYLLDPDIEMSIVDLPGEGQDAAGIKKSPGTLSLVTKIKEGNVDTDEMIRKYEEDLQEKFKKGISPSGTDEWQAAFVYHFDKSDKVMFLLNLYKVTESDEEIIYSNSVIEYAKNEFSDVSVVPIAVDLNNYDPSTFEPSFLGQTISPGRRDRDLLDHLKKHYSVGSGPKVAELLGSVEGNKEIDFFSVSVPDKGSPSKVTKKLTGDGEGGFVVNGFGQVIEWMKK